jgi:hypothetical protein
MSQNTNGGQATEQQQGGQSGGQQQAAGGGNQAQPSGSGQQQAQQQPQQQAGGQQGRGRSLTDWFANGAIRGGIVLVGFTLFLFALGQAVGLGLLDMFVGAVTSQTGRWLVVAAFALVLIFVGQQGVKYTSLSD